MNKELMPPWLKQVSSIEKSEPKKAFSRWIQLSTIGLDNCPRVRTVVFRGWSKKYEMEILTDKRSEKYKEIEINKKVELCWLFPYSKTQFRLRGISKINMDQEAQTHWENLPPKNKAMWTWPEPGYKYDENSAYPLELKNKKIKLENFILLKIKIYQVEQLLLMNPVHIRRRWLKINNWEEERINP